MDLYVEMCVDMCTVDVGWAIALLSFVAVSDETLMACLARTNVHS